MTTLPPRENLDAASTQGIFKTAIGDLRTFIADLLGTDSADKDAARTALGFSGIGNSIAKAADAAAARGLLKLPGTIAAADYGQTVQVNAAGTELQLAPPTAGFRNAIVNGGMDIAQRGDAATIAGGTSGFVVDRFLHLTGGSDSLDVSREAFAPGQTDVPGEPGYFMRIDKTASGTAAQSLRQRVEDVRSFAGRSVTLSYWAKAAAELTPPAITLRQNFGSGGSASVQLSVSPNPTYTTSWARYSHTVTLPSIAGKTLGAGHFLDVFWTLPDAAWTLDIHGMQLEAGTVATPFERRPAPVELAMCRRYFVRIGSGALATAHAANAIAFGVRWPAPMRAAPTVSLNTATPTIYQQGVGTQAGVDSTITPGGAPTEQGCHFSMSGFTGLTALDGRAVTLFTDCLDVDAEL